MAALLTPIAKSFGTDAGNDVASIWASRCMAACGFVEETGAAQFMRDVRITPIYEGTNGIQAMDLIGRKLSMDGGETVRRYLASVRAVADATTGGPLADLGVALSKAADDARAATDWMLEADMTDRGAGAVAYQRLMYLLAGGKAMTKGAIGATPARAALARFYANAMLAQSGALKAAACLGAEGLYALSPDDLAA